MKTKEDLIHFWWLYEMSLLETMEIMFSDTITIDYRDTIIAICSDNGNNIITWHGMAGHE